MRRGAVPARERRETGQDCRAAEDCAVGGSVVESASEGRVAGSLPLPGCPLTHQDAIRQYDSANERQFDCVLTGLVQIQRVRNGDLARGRATVSEFWILLGNASRE
jgi:hypothetical protein